MLINTTNTAPTEKEMIIQSNTLGFTAMKNNFAYSFSILERNPETVLAQFGTDAHFLFEGAAAVITCLKTIDSSYTPPISEHEYEFNEDGSVTVKK